MKNKYTVIDLFSGCGGFSQGFLKVGYEIIAANEIWNPAIETYRLNHGKDIMIDGDITSLEIKKKLYNRVKGKKINVIIGGPPCQGYSSAGNRNPDDPRGQLYLDFVEIIDHLKPDIFIMENVKGLLNMKHINSKLDLNEKNKFKQDCKRLQRYKDLKRYKAQRELDVQESKEFFDLRDNLKTIKNDINKQLIPLLNKILTAFKEINYMVSWKILNSADYGVPQTRERIIFIGTRHDYVNISFPKEEFVKTNTNSVNKKLHLWKTASEVLKRYENWPEDSERNHLFTKHSPNFIKKIKSTQIGDTVYKNYNDAWWRLDPEKPARTVKENHGGVFIHYKFDRACTPRELAALQSFDDDFIFKGTKSAILKQIGNAVPPLMAKAIALNIKSTLDKLK
ncbi:MAG: DNA cytosine methyltransferase [Promethearchaeota archaeon]